jgi:hypothetical protein
MGEDISCQTGKLSAAILTDCKGNRRSIAEKGRSDSIQRL